QGIEAGRARGLHRALLLAPARRAVRLLALHEVRARPSLQEGGLRGRGDPRALRLLGDVRHAVRLLRRALQVPAQAPPALAQDPETSFLFGAGVRVAGREGRQSRAVDVDVQRGRAQAGGRKRIGELTRVRELAMLRDPLARAALLLAANG